MHHAKWPDSFTSIRSAGRRDFDRQDTAGAVLASDTGIIWLKTKTPTFAGWRFFTNILGGPGRNRTTDTRIFNPLLYRLSYQAKARKYSKTFEFCKAHNEFRRIAAAIMAALNLSDPFPRRLFHSMNLQSDVCIVGNGAIGKTAALGFAQSGMSVTLLAPSSGAGAPVSQDPARWDLRVYALNGVARALLSSIKVWDALDASRIAPVDAMMVRGDGQQHAGNLSFDAYGARVDALAWIVEDANLNQALDTALRFAPGVQFVAGRAAHLRTDGDSATVQLENGDILGASLIVGADGGHSWVRGQCDIGLDYRSYGQRAVVANFSCEKPHHGVAYQWFTSADGIVALLPLPGQRVSLVWSAPEQLAQKLLSESQDQLAQRLSALPDQRLGQLHSLQPGGMKDFPLALIRPHQITAPRVALVGDAAHVVHPLAGHGMNLGFSDVASLMKTIAERDARQDCGDYRILARYARSRKEDILLMQMATDGLERLFSADFEPIRIARNLGLNLVNKMPMIKRRLMAHALGKIL